MNEKPKWKGDYYVRKDGKVVGHALPVDVVWHAQSDIANVGRWITKKAARKAVEEHYAMWNK